MVIPGTHGMSLKELGIRLYHLLFDHAIPDRAAQLSYYFVFALFPLLAFGVTLTAYIPIGNLVSALMERAAYVMPESAWKILEAQSNSMLHKPTPKLLTIEFLVAIWSGSRGVDAIRTALNLAYEVKETRPYWKIQAIALAMTLAGSILILLGFSLIFFGGKAGYWLAGEVGMSHPYLIAWAWLRWPITALLIMLTLALFYDLLPNIQPRFRFLTPGAVVSTSAWLLATWAFTQYVGHFGNYDATYGAIGGIIILLTWFYISGLLFILGGEINAVVDRHSTARSSAAPPAAA